MSIESEKERIVAEVPGELKALVDADQRAIREVVEAALWREYGGRRKSALERRIEEKERRISMIESERNERERELKEQRDELETLRRELQTVEDEAQSYTDDLDALLDDMVDSGMNVFESHGGVQSIATDHDEDPGTVIADLKDRVDDRELPLSNARFDKRVNGI